MSSLARKTGAKAQSYRQGYLRSGGWQKWRREYFEAIRATGKIPACQGCLVPESASDVVLDLHHMSYDGVREVPESGGWVSKERAEDVVMLCRDCHGRLHRLLDQPRSGWSGWDRRRASVVIIGRMRRKAVEEQSRSNR